MLTIDCLLMKKLITITPQPVRLLPRISYQPLEQDEWQAHNNKHSQDKA